MDLQEQENPTQHPGQEPVFKRQKMMEQTPQTQGQSPKSVKNADQFLWGFHIHKGQAIGKGAYGKVYLATKPGVKPNQEQKFAVKIFPTPKAKTSDHLSLRRQIDILKEKKSSHIIRFFFHASYNGQQYIFMELANGDVKFCIQRTLIPENEAISLLLQIIQGLYELHDEGIIHRDLKPENIFLIEVIENQEKKMIAKIGDFNLSRRDTAYTEKTACIGTPLYMAPQLYKKTKDGKSKYSHKCDIWSLGVIAYELVCQKTPWPICYNAPQLFRLIEQTVKKGIQFPQNIPISEGYKDLVRGCLQLQEKDRFDWEDIFRLPVIGIMDPIEIENSKPIITSLRRQVHQNNINLKSFLTDLPEHLSSNDVYYIFKALNHELCPEEIQKLTSLLFSEHDKDISRSQLVQFFQKNSFYISDNMELSEQEQDLWGLDSVSKIQRNIKALSQPFQQYKFFSSWIKKNPKMNSEVFEKMMRSLYSKASKKHLDKLYDYFNPEEFMQINSDTFVDQFCQFFQIVRYHDQKIENHINKMKKKKFQEMNEKNEKKEMVEETEMKE